VVFLPALVGFALLATGPAGGTVWQGRIPPATRPSIVYLPPRVSPVARYPVVYLLHGMPGDPEGFVGALRLADVADELGTPFVAVAPVAGPSWRYRGEWAGAWEDYLVRDVVPWVDARLPVGPRVIAGLSAGGYGAVDIALRHPGLFDTVESWGGYFEPFRDGPLARASRTDLAAHDPSLLVRREAPAFRRVRFFLSSGPTHGDVTQRSTSAFGAELARLGIPHVTWLLHTRKADWRAQLTAGLRFAFAPATS
jgi:pimeloyl-ACP methyl ester carboxylesterase